MTHRSVDRSAQHFRAIGPDVQAIPIQPINDAYRKVEKGDARFRYVIDRSTMDADVAA